MRLLCLWMLGILATAPATAQGPRSDQPLNVVVIYADDLGNGDLAVYGHPQFQTPRLDEMARTGARLTGFYSTCPYCAPSRASLLTGRYPFRSGMTSNPAPDAGKDDIGMPADERTLAEVFGDAGYETACYGKWHLGHRPDFYPTRHGFHEYFGILYSNDMRPVRLMFNEEEYEYPVDQRTLTERYTRRALDFIEAHRDKPFFLYLAHAMPHKPLAASDDFYQKTGTGLYGDVITELDASVGRILDRLEQLDLDERTLVIFTSDNGPWYGGSTGGLRGMKGQWWEGGVRVPFIARLPGTIPEGHVSDEMASILDVFPTTLALAGIAVPQDRIIDGRDILPLLTSDAPSPHERLFVMQGPRVRSMREGPWKLHPSGTPGPDRRGDDWVDPRAPDGTTILAPTEQARPSEFPGLQTGDRTREPALFHLGEDPAEQHDVAADHPDVVNRLMESFERFRQEAEAP